MKEKIYTIPVNAGFEADDECPFCAMERAVEQSAIRYVAGPGASYMEPEVRAATDAAGFCREHMKKLYDYGNTLGNALMLQTHMAALLEEFEIAADQFEMPAKKSLFSAKKPASTKDAYWKRLNERVCSCYLCDKLEYNMQRCCENRSSAKRWKIPRASACAILRDFWKWRNRSCPIASRNGSITQFSR